jgi:hypothetical protein
MSFLIRAFNFEMKLFAVLTFFKYNKLVLSNFEKYKYVLALKKSM